MGNVVKFEAHGKEYHLSVIGRDGQNWVTAQQVGEALGNKNIKKLIYGLQELGEITEGKHWSNVTFLQHGECQRRARILLSYRGIIRVAMRSQGSRAREFRDWAEDVLYEVMMTGGYFAGRSFPDALSRAESEGMKRALIVHDIADRHGMSMELVGRMIKLRKMGMTQAQVGAAFSMSRWQVHGIEVDLKEAGIHIPPVRKRSRKQSIDELVETLTASTDVPFLEMKGGAA